MKIYLDIVFLENMCMNYIILLASALIIKIRIRHIRLILSSLLGTIYSIISLIPNMDIYSTVGLKILLSIVMVFIAFENKTFKSLIKALLIFYLTSFAFGGCALFLLYFIKPENIVIKNGVYIGKYPIKIAFLGGIVGFTIIINAFKIIKIRLSKKDMFCYIDIFLKNKKATVKAFIDSGNMLKEPIGGAPVIVVESDSLKDIFPEIILKNIEKIIGGDYENMISELEKKEYISKFRIIPFSSLGNENAILLGFKADKVKISKDENEYIYTNAVIGIYDKKLSKYNEYSALVGLEMFEDGEEIA